MLIRERVVRGLGARGGSGEVAPAAVEPALRLALDLVVVDDVAPRREAVTLVAVLRPRAPLLLLRLGAAAVPRVRAERVGVLAVSARASDAFCG